MELLSFSVVLTLMASIAQGAYMDVNQQISNDCSVGEVTRYTFTESSVLDFRDLQYYSVADGIGGLNQQIQMHCHPDKGYQILVWHGSHGSVMRAGTVGVGGENTWDYTGYPEYAMSVSTDRGTGFLAGECINQNSLIQGNSDEFGSVTFVTEGATVYLPDCEDYAPDVFCPNCYPMSEFLGLGFDLTEDSSHLNQRQHVARLFGSQTAIEGSTYTSIDNTDFREVDRVVQTGSTSSFEDSRSVQSSRSLDLSVAGSYGVADIEASVGLSESESNSFESSMARSETVLQKGLNSLEFKASDSNYYPTFQFWKAMNSMNERCINYPPDSQDFTDESNPWCYEHFLDEVVEEFGTHYISKITMGGQVKFIMETSSCLEASERATAVTSAVCVGVEDADVEGCVEGSTANTVASETSSAISSFMLEIVGGDDSVSLQVCTYSDDGFDCDFAAFTDTVNDDTAGVVTFELREVAALVNKVSGNAGRWQSVQGGWLGFAQVDLDDFYKEYIESKAMANQGCCGGCTTSATSSGAHFSLVTLIAAVCFTVFN